MSETTARILQRKMPDGQAEAAMARLPAVQPVVGNWLSVDDAYKEQMGLRRFLLRSKPNDVYAQTPQGLAAAQGFVTLAIKHLPEGFSVNGDVVDCPDGERVTLDWDAPLWSIGQVLQQDVCILEKHESEHVLTGAVLCFPASWTLAEKIGKPLLRIHKPVAEYDEVAPRVQRFFDGVKDGRPLWRANMLRYDNPALHQPRKEGDPRPVGQADAPYLRSERQTMVRLPQPEAAAFVIHTTVVLAASEDDCQSDHAQQRD